MCLWFGWAGVRTSLNLMDRMWFPSGVATGRKTHCSGELNATIGAWRCPVTLNQLVSWNGQWGWVDLIACDLWPLDEMHHILCGFSWKAFPRKIYGLMKGLMIKLKSLLERGRYVRRLSCATHLMRSQRNLLLHKGCHFIAQSCLI